ncbi:hypothetical protein M2306_003474 [Myroides gitamensis]|nr:hypothetical protein [Myroides gitamensis]
MTNYRIINWIFFLLMLCLFGYIFLLTTTTSTTLSIRSACEGLPEALCKSRGLTRDFMALVRGKKELINPYSYSIFLFFVYVGVSRGMLLLLPTRLYNKKILVVDIVILCLFFLYAFLPLLGLT